MDGHITTWINGFVGASPTFDGLLAFYLANDLVKGLPIAVIFLYLWFVRGPDRDRRRTMLLATVVLAVVAIAAGRLLAKLLPHRLRPLQADPSLTLAPGTRPEDFDGWSSLPSDHAVLFFGLAAAFWLIDRKAGLLMALHAVIAVAVARVYFSLHWATDILLGALVGIAIVLVLMRPLCRLGDRMRLVEHGARHPEWLHPLLFVALFQIATMFNSARAVVFHLAGLFA